MQIKYTLLNQLLSKHWLRCGTHGRTRCLARPHAPLLASHIVMFNLYCTVLYCTKIQYNTVRCFHVINYFHSIDKINSASKSAVCSFGSVVRYLLLPPRKSSISRRRKKIPDQESATPKISYFLCKSDIRF